METPAFSYCINKVYGIQRHKLTSDNNFKKFKTPVHDPFNTRSLRDVF